ncbi:MAG TPA: hypothetical protein VM689_03680 [Aliidongia sp.]|nr:hypothetical protein [Aliidongia sp.]
MSGPESDEAALARIEAGLIEDGPETYSHPRKLERLCCSQAAGTAYTNYVLSNR